jgi:hypothetical protein
VGRAGETLLTDGQGSSHTASGWGDVLFSLLNVLTLQAGCSLAWANPGTATVLQDLHCQQSLKRSATPLPLTIRVFSHYNTFPDIRDFALSNSAW